MTGKSMSILSGIFPACSWKQRTVKLRAYAAGHMLDTANDWLGDADEEPITAEQFADRITLSELAFRNDGSIEAYYDDGDIFWGHCIIVRMDKNGNIEDAEIAG